MAWTRVCKAEDVPSNSIKKFMVADIPILIARHDDGYLALPPVCPHMEEPLAESGVIAGCVLTCTKHLWAWDLKTMELQGETEKPLKTYDLRVDGDDIMVLVEKELFYDFDDDDDMDDDDFFN